MKLLLLSGGSGTRLWPLSNEVKSKQFLRLFRDDAGKNESMIQRVFRQARKIDKNSEVAIATNRTQVPAIRGHLGDEVGISVEPGRRDTFPAIALGMAYLKEKRNCSDDDTVIIMPADSYVDDRFFEALEKLNRLAETSEANITLMGVEPTEPSSRFGYIVPCEKAETSRVAYFKEKPDEENAKKLIEQGAMWNCGVFACTIGYVLKKTETILGTGSYNDLLERYNTLEKISFDYAVVEHEESIDVLKFSGEWKDIGTWDTLVESLEENVIGNGRVVDCRNAFIVNQLSMPVLVNGLDDVVVCSTPDGILVSDLKKADRLKSYVGEISERPMSEERAWGTYRVLDFRDNNGKKSLTKELVIYEGCNISYQIHEKRAETWTVIQGEGLVIADDKVISIGFGDTVVIERGQKHAVKAISELHIIEVQTGEELIEDDINVLTREWPVELG